MVLVASATPALVALVAPHMWPSLICFWNFLSLFYCSFSFLPSFLCPKLRSLSLFLGMAASSCLGPWASCHCHVGSGQLLCLTLLTSRESQLWCVYGTPALLLGHLALCQPWLTHGRCSCELTY